MIDQTPAAGEKAKKDSEVEILIAVGNGKVAGPQRHRPRPGRAAEKALRARRSSRSVRSSRSRPTPKAKIESQIPAEKEVVQEGTPIDIFLATIKDKKAGGKTATRTTAAAAEEAAAARPRR